MSYFEKWQEGREQDIKMFSTCFIFTILGAKAFAKLKLFELAITWCDQGLAVSFYSLYSSIAEKWFIFATCCTHFHYDLSTIFLDYSYLNFFITNYTRVRDIFPYFFVCSKTTTKAQKKWNF